MKYAIVKDNKVVNVIRWDGESRYTCPEGCELVKLQGKGGIGWDYIDRDFVDNRPKPEKDEEAEAS